MLNPLGPLNPFINDDELFGPQQSQQQQPGAVQLPPLSPEEEASLLESIGHGALSGLGWVGGSIDKAFGGRAIRGLLGGKPEELASIIPFSDTLGITKPENAVSGAELLGNKDASFFSPEGLAGMALEVALDPGTYLTLGSGALTKAGQQAGKLGILPKNLAARTKGFAAGTEELTKLATALGKPEAELAGRALGGHMGLSLPFGLTDQAVFDLSGVPKQLADATRKIPVVGPKVVGAAQKVGDAANAAWTKSIGPLFYSPYGGQTLPPLQDISATQHELLPQVRAQFLDKVRDASLAAQDAGLLNPEVLNQMAPKFGKENAGWSFLNDLLEGQVYGPFDPKVQNAADLYREADAFDLAQKQAVGLAGAYPLTPQTRLAGEGAGLPIGHVHRQWTVGEIDPNYTRKWETDLTPVEEFAREAKFRGLTKNQINDLGMLDLSNIKPAQAQQVIGQKFLGVDVPALQAEQKALLDRVNGRAKGDFFVGPGSAIEDVQPFKSGLATGDEIKRLNDIEASLVQTRNLSNWKAEIGTAAGPVFGNNPFDDLLSQANRDARRVVQAQGLHKGIAAMAGTADELAKEGQRIVPVKQVLNEAGLTFNVAGQPEATGAMNATLQEMMKAGKATKPEDLLNLYVPEDAAKALTRFTKASTLPDGLKPIVQAWDALTNWTKTFQTVLWPANHTRNQFTAFFQNFIHDAGYPGMGPMSYVQPWLDAKSFHDTGSMQGLASKIPMFKGLTDEAANLELQRLVAIHDVYHRAGSLAREGLEEGNTRVAQTLLPGPQKSLTERLSVLKDAPLDDWKKLSGVHGSMGFDQAGRLGEYTQDVFPLAKAGRGVASTLDDINRLSSYLGFLSQGFDPAVAAQKVLETHFDFQNLSKVERSVMRRVIPFYGWARQSIPSVLYQIATNPGGKMGQSIRAASEMRGSEPGFLPSYLGGGVAMPVGDQENGTQRYLTSLGLPFEELGQLAQGPQSLLGMLNPLAKAPLEVATNKQFFTGRDLRDLYSQTGSILGDQVLMNSPFGRAATTLRTLTDPRKDLGTALLNVGTGLRMSDVDVDKQKNIAARQYAEDMLRGQPGVHMFQRLYVRPQDLPLLDPNEVNLLRLVKTAERRQQQRGRP